MSSDLRPYVLNTWVKRRAELSTDHPHQVTREDAGQMWKTQRSRATELVEELVRRSSTITFLCILGNVRDIESK